MSVLHQLLKSDRVLDKSLSYMCPICNEEVTPDNIKVVQNLMIPETQSLLQSTNPMKLNIIYITGYLSKNCTCNGAI